MGTDPKRPSHTYAFRWNPGVRLTGFAAGLFLSAVWTVGIVSVIEYQRDHPERREPLATLLPTLIGIGLLDLMCITTMLGMLRAGRLELADDRVWLPRLPLGPLGLLPAREVRFDQVERFGYGVQPGHGQFPVEHPVVMFRTRDADGNRRTLRLSLTWYSESAEILALLAMRIRAPVEHLHRHWFWGLHFRRYY